jgi:hypothetical protein
MQAESGFPLQSPFHMRATLLGGHAQLPMPMIRPGMPLDPCETPWIAACLQALAYVLPEGAQDGNG